MEQVEGADGARTIIVVTGGDPVGPHVRALLPVGARVVAADSGVVQARALGLHVDVAVGDFDSLDPVALRRAVEAGARVERHPEAKDATDLELALDVALAARPDRIVVVGGHGGRLDHLLANALVLAGPRTAGVELVAHLPPATVTVVRDRATLHGEPGDLVSLLPAHGPAGAVSTEGLLYPLVAEDLPAGSTRGVSNELVARRAVVSIGSGVLLAVQPGGRGDHLDRAAELDIPIPPIPEITS
ncbi:MAG: thiamine diphosphokinase [Acidimicrobiia bacterium]